VNKSSEIVSIVLPTYNGSRYLRQSINSCLKQTYQNIELIIVDDGSTDETPTIIQSYKDARIKYIKHEKNRRLPHTLNTGFNYATGEYLTWTSDDNLFAENAIEKMLAFLKDKNLEFVYCDYYSFENDDLQNRRIIKLPDNSTSGKQTNLAVCFLYSRKVKEVVGDYDPDFFLVEDYDYWLRVSQQFPMGHLNEPLYFYRTHAASASSLKYYEQTITIVLVWLRYGRTNIKQAVDFLFNNFAYKYWGYQRINKVADNVFYSRNSHKVLKALKNIITGVYWVYRKINKARIIIFLSRKISKVLMDFKMGSLSLAETKLALQNILMGKE